MLAQPSPISEVVLPGQPGTLPVLIPQNEMFRIRNIFNAHEYAIAPQYLPSGPLTIVDAGANVGLFALYMKGVRSDCDIHCFEPVPQTLALLEKNTARDGRIRVYPYALMDRDGTVELSLHPHNSGENTVQRDRVPAGRTIKVPSRDAAGQMQTLGLSYIDILKIDTEGCEVDILTSLQPCLPYVGIVMAEYHSEKDRRAIDGLLSDHVLFDARSCGIGLGLVKYINKRLTDEKG